MVLIRWSTLATMTVVILWCDHAFAERPTTREALDRLGEILELRLDDGTLRKPEIVPALVVSMQARFEESVGWYPAEALTTLVSAFGAKDLRACEACMLPRVFAQPGFLEHSSGPISLEEVKRLDENARGSAEPARTAIWLDEHASGVSIRIVDLATSRILFSQNVDPVLRETANTEGLMLLSEELERRSRGDSITQVFVDLVLLPGQHFSFDWTDQWGDTNSNFTGLSISAFDPVLGLGLVYYRVIDIFHIAGIPIAPQVGGKLIMSLPTAIVEGITSEAGDLLDPLLTGVLVVRVPFGGSNYALVATASTNLRFGIGISLLNISFLPVIP